MPFSSPRYGPGLVSALSLRRKNAPPHERCACSCSPPRGGQSTRSSFPFRTASRTTAQLPTTWIERRASSNDTRSAAASAERIGPPCVTASTSAPSWRPADAEKARDDAGTELVVRLAVVPAMAVLEPAREARPGTAASTSVRVSPDHEPTSTSSSEASATGSRSSASARIAAVSAARRSGLVYVARERSRARARARAPRACARPVVVERRVRVSLEAVVAVPVGLAVPDQDDRRRHAGYASCAWISVSRGRGASSPARRAESASRSARQLVAEGALVVSCGRRGAPGVGEAAHVVADLSLAGRARARGRRGRGRARRPRRPRQQRRRRAARALRGRSRRGVGRLLAAERHELRARDPRRASALCATAAARSSTSRRPRASGRRPACRTTR